MTLKDKRILIVSPHIDDEAICSGGLIMKAKEEGATVFVIYMAIGESRQFMNGKTRAKDRVAEAQKASKYGNFEYMMITEQSTKLDTVPQKTLIEAIENTTRRFKPDIVVIPYRNSFNQDHRATASAAITAFRPIPKDLHHQPEMILEMEEPYTWPVPSSPNLYVEISIEDKLALYNYHLTQIPEDPFPRSRENLTRLAGFRGCEIGVKYAEGYNLLKGQL